MVSAQPETGPCGVSAGTVTVTGPQDWTGGSSGGESDFAGAGAQGRGQAGLWSRAPSSGPEWSPPERGPARRRPCLSSV